MRKSILACTVSLLMSPVATWALGMGDVQVNSSLNQPLHAEIGIHSASKKDIESLKLNIASKDAFAKAGIYRSHYLTKFKFDIKQKNGKTIVSITTNKSFKEPYIEFLIEANWNSGRLIREYTILVDPPEFVNMQSLPVRNAEVDSSSVIKRSSSTYSSMDALSYGPTIRNDTLWKIAKNMAPADVSINQMMLALLKENPDAFFNNNINNLKAGYVLRINNQKNLYQLDKRSAQREVSQQYQSWKDLRAQQSANTNLVDRSERKDKVDTDGELKLLASGKSHDADIIDKDSTTEEQAKEIKKQLALTIEAIDSATSENLELRERVKELEAILETKSSLLELKDESLSALQKQIELKNLESSAETDAAAEDVIVEENIEEEVIVDTIIDDEFADHIDASVELAKDEMLAMQAENSAAETDVTEKQMVDEKETIDTEETIETKEIVDTKDAVIIEEVIATKETVIEKTINTTAVENIKETSVEIAATDKATIQDKKKEAIKKPADNVDPVKPLVPVYEQIPALLMGEYLPYTAGGLGFFVILLIALKMRSGKKEEELEFEESILDQNKVKIDSNSFKEQMESNENIDELDENDNETSFLSDFSADNTESLMPDDTEADPLAEADVFMIYGRYLQAEEFLKEVIINEPQRLDFQMKLLEVYLADNQNEAFITQAELIKDLINEEYEGINESSDWDTVVSWAKKLDIELSNEDSDSESVENIDDIAVSDSDELSLDDNLDEQDFDAKSEVAFNEIEPSELEIEENITKNSLVEPAQFTIDESELIDLDDENTSSDESAAGDNTAQDDAEKPESVDLDADDKFSLELENIELDDAEESIASESLNDDANSIKDKDEAVIEEEFSLDLDSFDLDEIDDQDVDDAIQKTEIEDIEDIDDADISLDDDFELDLSDLEDLEGDIEEANAVDNKLDLARAYIDMEDPDSAASLLSEVINEGDEEQKAQAKMLQEQAGSK